MANALVLFLLLSLPVYGQSDGEVPAHFRSFAGGINDNSDAVNLREDESPDAINIFNDGPIGSLKPRTGFTLCGYLPSGNTPSALFEYAKANGVKRLIVSDNTTVYETPDCKTFTTIKASLTAAFKPNFAVVRDKLWTVNRDTHPFTWDGTTTVILDGLPNTPDPPPPIGRYIQFWNERVWIANTSAEPSSVAFSAITDASGNDQTPSTGTASFPATNVVYVDRDGGSPVFAIKGYRDNMYVFKEDGIWRIHLRNDFDVAVIKTLSGVGCRFNETIKEVDGLLRFVGPDGIYAFDGDKSVRISANIQTKFDTLKQPIVNNLFKAWTDQSDFDDGVQLLNVATGTITGSIEIGTTVFIDSPFAVADVTLALNDTVISGHKVWTALSNANSTIESEKWVIPALSPKNYILSTPNLIESRVGETARSWEIDIKYTFTANGEANFWFITRDTTTIDSSNADGYVMRYNNAPGMSLSRYADGLETVLIAFDSSEAPPVNTTGKFKITWSTGGSIGVFLDEVFLASTTDTTYTTSSGSILHAFHNNSGGGNIQWDNFKERIYYTSGTWTSDIFDAVTVSAWSSFTATEDTNGNSIQYGWRTGDDDAELNGSVFQDVISGVIIDTATARIKIQTRAQASNIGPDNAKAVEVKEVTVNYTQGGVSAQTIYAHSWKERYWVTASSGEANTNNIVMQTARSPSNAWMFHDLQVAPMTEFNDNFYAGASTHGAIYQLDNGTNDQGVAIEWHWITRDEVWGAPYRKKDLLEIDVDFRKGTAEFVDFGFKRGDQTTFTNKVVDMSGTGRGIHRSFTAGSNSIDYRFRVGGQTLDETVTVLGISAFAVPYKRRQ